MKMVPDAGGIYRMPREGLLPWDSLGVRLPEDADVMEVLELSNLDWEVQQGSVYDEGGYPIPNNRVLYRTYPGKRKPTHLGIVTASYRRFQNAELVALASQIVDEEHGVWESAGALQDGRKIFVVLRLVKGQVEIREGDSVEHYLVLLSSHDAKLGITVYVTTVRPTCANVMWTPHHGRHGLRLTHIGNLAHRSKILRQGMRTILRDVAYRSKQLRYLDIPATPERVLTIYEALFPTYQGIKELQQYTQEGNLASRVYAADRTCYKVDKHRQKVQDCITQLSRQSVRGPATLWDLWQGYTDYLDHSYVARDPLRHSRCMLSLISGKTAERRRKALGVFLQVAEEAK